LTEYQKKRRAAQVLCDAASSLTYRIINAMRRAGQRAHLAHIALDTLGNEADKHLLTNEIDICGREWVLLEAWEQDLLSATAAAELLSSFEDIDGIVDEVPYDDPLEPFPPLTAEYRELLRKELPSC
jgi:hypothetical protein